MSNASGEDTCVQSSAKIVHDRETQFPRVISSSTRHCSESNGVLYDAVIRDLKVAVAVSFFFQDSLPKKSDQRNIPFNKS